MTPEPLPVGLIGFGHAGSVFHAPLVDATPGLRLAAIVTGNAERRALASTRYPAARVSADVDSLLSGPDRVDLVVVATPNRSHLPLALASLDAGRALVVDKPFAASAADARRVVAAARERRVPLTVFHNRRWDGDFLTVRRIVAEGRLGRVHRFETRFERWRPVRREVWREEAAPESAGGLLFDLGTHLIDQALLLFGPVDHVYAELDRRRPGALVDDDPFVALTHRDGTRTHVWAGQVAAHRAPRFRVLGSAGAFVKSGLDGQSDALAAGARPDAPDWGREPEDLWGHIVVDDRSHAVPTESGGYQVFYAAVRDAVRNGAPMPVDPEDAVRGLEVIEAAVRADREGRIVRVGEGGD